MAETKRRGRVKNDPTVALRFRCSEWLVVLSALSSVEAAGTEHESLESVADDRKDAYLEAVKFVSERLRYTLAGMGFPVDWFEELNL